MVFVSGQITATIINYRTPQIGGYIGISNIFLLSTFIYATAPGSGGHLNPMISFSAILAGICPVARGTPTEISLAGINGS
jgi:glycerol uptake facilitator-like aquaporin